MQDAKKTKDLSTFYNQRRPLSTDYLLQGASQFLGNWANQGGIGGAPPPPPCALPNFGTHPLLQDSLN
jgi:hypothetical protein